MLCLFYHNEKNFQEEKKWVNMLSERSQTQKPHTLQLHLYEILKKENPQWQKAERLLGVKKWSEVKSLSRVRLFATPWTVAYQAPLSMGFSRQQYWSGSPFPSPGYLPDPGIKSRSPALQTDALPSEPSGKSWEWKGEMQRNMKEIVGVMEMLYILTVKVIQLMSKRIKPYILTLIWWIWLHVTYTSTKFI